MNRTHLIRTLSLGLASLALATASLAGTTQQEQLRAAYFMAETDAQVAVELQAWVSQRDIALLAQADGLITNDMRADAEQYAIAMLVEADGLVTAQLRQDVETLTVARVAAADGLVVAVAELAPAVDDSTIAQRSADTVLLAVNR